MCACVCACASFFSFAFFIAIIIFGDMSAFIELGGAEPVYITHNVLMKVCGDFGNDARNNFGLRLVISFCKSF